MSAKCKTQITTKFGIFKEGTKDIEHWLGWKIDIKKICRSLIFNEIKKLENGSCWVKAKLGSLYHDRGNL